MLLRESNAAVWARFILEISLTVSHKCKQIMFLMLTQEAATHRDTLLAMAITLANQTHVEDMSATVSERNLQTLFPRLSTVLIVMVSTSVHVKEQCSSEESRKKELRSLLVSQG